jgi:hypothetical protein
VGERLVGPLDNAKELIVGAESSARGLLEMNSNQGGPHTRRIALQALDMDMLGEGDELHDVTTGLLAQGVVLLHLVVVAGLQLRVVHLLVNSEGDIIAIALGVDGSNQKAGGATGAAACH